MQWAVCTSANGLLGYTLLHTTLLIPRQHRTSTCSLYVYNISSWATQHRDKTGKYSTGQFGQNGEQIFPFLKHKLCFRLDYGEKKHPPV